MCPHAVANLHTAGGQNPIMLGTLPTEPYPRQESVSVALFVQGVEDLPPPTPPLLVRLVVLKESSA